MSNDHIKLADGSFVPKSPRQLRAEGAADERARIQAEIKALHECAATCEGAWMELREYITRGESDE